MKRLLLSGLVVGCIAVVWMNAPLSGDPAEAEPGPPAEAHPRPVRQLAIARALGSAAEPDHVQRLLTQTDTLNARHADPQALMQEIQHQLQRAAPSETQLRAYYAERPELFAYRSFEESRPAIEQILKVRLVRAALLGQDEGGLPHSTVPDGAPRRMVP